MTSLADLGEIAKANTPPEDDVTGYRRGILARMPTSEDDVYFRRGAAPAARRQGKSWGGLLGGGAAGALAGAGLAAATKGKAKRPISESVLPGLGAGIGAGTGAWAGLRSSYRNDDVRAYNKDTGLRRHPGFWRPKTYQGTTQ